jgi:hypothetical protein
MLGILSFLFHLLPKIIVPICFVSAWALVFLVILSLWVTVRDSVTVAKKMHEIPCTGCQFFTDDYHLKCTVHPSVANTEEAIDCLDFQAKVNEWLY